MKQTILVTGGTGFIGSHTTVELQQAGYEVVIVDNLANSNVNVLDGIEKITGIRPAFEQVDCCDMPALENVFKKYPKITGVIMTLADLKIPGNKLMDYAKMDEADFDNDHTDEYVDDEKADEFKEWILKWCARSTEKDKMRVRNWFQTKKSHKQIFAEIQKVVGNPSKFNSRLALFVERLFNNEGTEYFFEKTGFATKEDLFMAYFEKLTQFDEETKKSFIKKYLLG